jgi:hypothetical protein
MWRANKKSRCYPSAPQSESDRAIDNPIEYTRSEELDRAIDVSKEFKEWR